VTLYRAGKHTHVPKGTKANEGRDGKRTGAMAFISMWASRVEGNTQQKTTDNHEHVHGMGVGDLHKKYNKWLGDPTVQKGGSIQKPCSDSTFIERLKGG